MKLTAAARKRIPPSKFGLAAKKGSANRGRYPMPDKNHAKVAKAYASKEENDGKLSPSSKGKIDAKANKVLGIADRLKHLRPA